MVFGESASDDLRVFKIPTITQSLTMLTTKLNGLNNTITLFSTTLKKMIAGKKLEKLDFTQMEAKEYKHPILSYNNLEADVLNYKVWYNNSMDTIIIENLNRDLFQQYSLQPN